MAGKRTGTLLGMGLLLALSVQPLARAQSSPPVITSASTLDAGWIVTNRDQDPDYSYTITAANGPTQFGAINLPPGASLDSHTGTIRGLASQPGTWSFTVTATNGAGTGSAPLTIRVHPCAEGASYDVGEFGVGSVLHYYVFFNETLFVSGTPLVTSGGYTFSYVSGSGTGELVFAHTVTAADAAGYFSGFVTVNLNGGSLQDANGLSASLTVPPPQIGSPPNPQINPAVRFTNLADQTATVGVGFSYHLLGVSGNQFSQVTAAGLPPGLAIDTSLGLISGTPTTPGTYAVVATGVDAQGGKSAGAFTLTVDPVSSPAINSNPGRLVNLSALAPTGPGSQILTVGFVSGGAGTSGTQPILVRGIGPALAGFGVANAVADPSLTLFSGQVPLWFNDNWGTTAGAVTTADTATGAFTLANPSSLDAALVASVAPGSYTAQVASATSGMALAEIYDDTSAYALASPRLINLSCLAQVQGTSTLTVGFVIGGSTSRSILIRAAGPALASFGVSGFMTDPTLALHSNATGQDTILARNAAWGGDPALSAAFQAVGAFAFPSAASADSALLITLPPGSYTAVAGSASGAGGSVLVEVYEAP